MRLVNFNRNGGIEQYSGMLFENLRKVGLSVTLVESPRFTELLDILDSAETVIFTSNNKKIYLAHLLSRKRGRRFLICHDAKLRPGDGLRERLSLWLVRRWHSIFTQIIFHHATEWAPDNSILLELPLHGLPDLKSYKRNVEKTIRVLCFGRIVHYKNIRYLLDIACLESRIEVIIAGSGSLKKDELQDVTASQNIVFINQYVPNTLMDILFDWADMLWVGYSDVTATNLVDQAIFSEVRPILSDIKQFDRYNEFAGVVKIPLNNPDEAKNIILKSAAERKDLAVARNELNELRAHAIRNQSNYIARLHRVVTLEQ